MLRDADDANLLGTYVILENTVLMLNLQLSDKASKTGVVQCVRVRDEDGSSVAGVC